MTKIHTLAGRFGNPRDIGWPNYRISVPDHIPFTQHLVQAAHEGYQQAQGRNVPRLMLRCALYFLSLGAVAPTYAIADFLTITAIDLDCDVSNAGTLDESCV